MLVAVVAPLMGRDQKIDTSSCPFHLSSRCQHSDKLSFDPFPFWILLSLGRHHHHHHHHFHFQSDLLFWWLNQSDEQRCLAPVLFLN